MWTRRFDCMHLLEDTEMFFKEMLGKLMAEKHKLRVFLALEHPFLGYLTLILCTY